MNKRRVSSEEAKLQNLRHNTKAANDILSIKRTNQSDVDVGFQQSCADFFEHGIEDLLVDDGGLAQRVQGRIDLATHVGQNHLAGVWLRVSKEINLERVKGRLVQVASLINH